MTLAVIVRTSLAAAVAGLIWLPQAAAAQVLGQAASPDVPWLRVIAALLLCLGLAVGAAFALKARLRVGAPLFSQGRRRLQAIEALRLSHQVDVHLFSADGREILVVATPQGVTIVADTPVLPQPSASPEPEAE